MERHAIEQEHADHHRHLRVYARELTQAAVWEALAGNCESVRLIQQQVLELPDMDIEGGAHDTMFLREPAILACLRLLDRHGVPSSPARATITAADAAGSGP